jgi:oxygen-independent coproporphyrinogen-3 oxidase
MELPYNTVISRRILDEGQASPIPDWATKRRWVSDAMDLFGTSGYRVASATTIATTKKPCNFVYTDGLWKGTDMIALGVSSFGYFGGVHMQNAHGFQEYLNLVESGKLPIVRAYPMKDNQRLIREMILQLKTGRIERRFFSDKFGVDIAEAYGTIYDRLEREGMLTRDNGSIVLSRKGLLQVDGFLKEFFEPQFQNVRYT